MEVYIVECFQQQSPEHQMKLCQSGLVQVLMELLAANVYKVQMPVLKCLSVVVKDNEENCAMVAAGRF